MKTPRFGIISGMIKDMLQENPEDTMSWLAKLGLKGIESGERVADLPIEAYTAMLKKHGLEPVATPAKREQLRDEMDEVIQRAQAIGCKYVMCYWAEAESAEQIKRDAELFNRTGLRLAQEGLTLCYHNHDHELNTEIEGTTALEFLIQNTDPKALSIELDVAWVVAGGADPVQLIRKYANRIPVLHLKDLHALEERGQFTTLGTGIVDVNGCIAAAREIGCDWLVLEQDRTRNLERRDSLECAMFILRENGWL